MANPAQESFFGLPRFRLAGSYGAEVSIAGTSAWDGCSIDGFSDSGLLEASSCAGDWVGTSACDGAD